MVNRKIGYSLPFNYIIGNPSADYYSIFDSTSDCLNYLKEAGVDSIELRCVLAETAATQVKLAYDMISGQGMSMTIHGVLPKLGSGESILTPLSTLPSDVEYMVTLHAYSGNEDHIARYVDETVSALRSLLDESAENIRFALEVNRSKQSYYDPSYTYKGVLEMVDAVGSPRLGVCWDFGHTAANIRNRLMDQLPVKTFPAKVAHTHIHDLSIEGKTHFPLLRGEVPLDEFILILLNVDYKGCFNLEFNLERWPGSALEKRDAISRSIKKLQHSLNQGNTP